MQPTSFLLFLISFQRLILGGEGDKVPDKVQLEAQLDTSPQIDDRINLNYNRAHSNAYGKNLHLFISFWVGSHVIYSIFSLTKA